jgi:aldehyde dehydrogenase (NAD+)
VHQAAAQNLTPAVLELGGKNPTIVHSSAHIRTAARRIAYGRYVNSGHICTAPDHVLVWPEVKDELVAELKQAIHDFYGDDPKQSPDYGRVINRRNFDRLAGFLSKDNGTVAAGGQTDPDQRYIEPTVLVDVPVDSPIMQEEVFGPILPVLEIDSVQKVIDWVNERLRHPGGCLGGIGGLGGLPRPGSGRRPFRPQHRRLRRCGADGRAGGRDRGARFVCIA